LWTPPSVRTCTSRLRSSRHQSTTAKRYLIKATDTKAAGSAVVPHLGERHLAADTDLAG
jgi:hypothetical protein